MAAIGNANKCSTEPAKETLLQYEAGIAAGIIESKAQYRKIVKAGISQWVKDFQKGMIDVKTVDDLKKLIELDIALQREDIE